MIEVRQPLVYKKGGELLVTRTRQLCMTRACRAVWVIALGLAQMAALPAAQANAAERRSLTPIDYVQLTDFSGQAVSPDGRHIAVRTTQGHLNSNRVRNTVRLIDTRSGRIVRTLDGGAPDWIPLYGLVDAEQPIWSQDSKQVFFKFVSHGKSDIVTAPVQTRLGKARQLTFDANVDDMLPMAGSNEIYYFSTSTLAHTKQLERDERARGVLLTPNVIADDAIAANGQFRDRTATIRKAPMRPGAKYFGVGEPLGVSDSPVLKALDPRSGREFVISPSDPRYARAVKKQRGDESNANKPRATFKVSPGNAGGRPTAEIKYVGGGLGTPFIICEHPSCKNDRVRAVALRPASREVLFIVEDEFGRATLYAWNPFTDHIRTIFRAAGLLEDNSVAIQMHRSSMCSLSPKFAFCVVSSPKIPPRLERINLDNGRAKILYDPNQSIRRRIHAEPQPLAWSDKWGRPHTGILLRPEFQKSPVPLVITSYTCEGYLRGASYVPEYILAAQGFAVLCVNFDTAAYYDKPYPDSRIPTGAQADLQTNLDGWESAVRYLSAQGLIDRSKVGVAGISFGAGTVQYALQWSNEFAVGVAGSAGILDPSWFYTLSAGGDAGSANLKYYNMPDPSRDMGFYRKWSPSLNVNEIKAPLLVQVSDNEAHMGMEFFTALREHAKPAEVYIFADEAHHFMQPLHQYIRIVRAIDWFRFWLQGFEDQGPAKRLQYDRWRKLRDMPH